MLQFSFDGCIDKFYPYRSAQLCATLWVDLDEVGVTLLAHCIENMGYHLDNHICWRMKDGLCLAYSDHKLGVGTEIIEEKW